MNDTTASIPGAALLPDGIDVMTAIAFALMAILAIAAIATIVAGARRKRLRVAAERQVERRAEDAGVAPAAPPVDEPAPDVIAPAPAPAPAEPDAPAPERPLADEPIAAAAPLEASPATVAADVPAPSAAVPGDAPITQLKGLGPKLADRLAALGITTVGQLAALTDDEAATLDAELGPFAGRMSRDRWIEQSRFLAAGDRAGFEAVFGRL